MKLTTHIIAFFVVAVLSGCAITTTKTYIATGTDAICKRNSKLGKIAVLPEAAWRSDQKEPKVREAMALQEIKNSFQNISCDNLTDPEGVKIKKFSKWSSRPEHELVKQFSTEGIDTIILLRIEELTPNFIGIFCLRRND